MSRPVNVQNIIWTSTVGFYSAEVKPFVVYEKSFTY